MRFQLITDWRLDMLGMVGTVLVISQMAGLSLGVPAAQLLVVGLISAIVWSIRAISLKDKWLLLTNVAVGGFAIYGLVA